MDAFKTERSSPPSTPRALAALAVAFLVIGSESFAEGRSLCLPKQTGTKHPARLRVHNASWASSKYTTQIARILLEEKMGVDVEFVNFNGPTYQIYELVGSTELCPAQRAPKGHGGPTVTGDQGAHGGP